MQTGDHDYTKITVKVYEPILKDINKRLNQLFIKRDDFINHLLDIELEHLSAELKGLKQSNVAKKYISNALKKTGTKTVNIVIRKTTANKLKQICDETNIMRDAFFNRLLLLLRADTKLLDYLDLPAYIAGESFYGIEPPVVPSVPLVAIEECYEDPFMYLRQAAKVNFKSGLYLMDMWLLLSIDSTFLGFTCYLHDSEVPGTEAYVKAQEESEKLLNNLIPSAKDKS